MIEILGNGYKSKSESFLLPLTGLQKGQKYNLRTYLFWEKYSIEDYYLILKFNWDNYEEFLRYCKVAIFPTLTKNGYLVESHDFENETVFVVNLDQWAFDIEMFLKGSYSKLSEEAKTQIGEFHTFNKNGPKILIEISAVLRPNEKFPVLGNLTPIEYVAENYGLPLDELKKVGEIGGKYQKDSETLSFNNQKLVESE